MQSKWKKFIHNENTVGFLFIGLWLFGFIAFTIFPMLMSLVISFTNYKGMGAYNFVGFANYVRMFKSDPRFWTAFWNTVVYVAIYVPLRLIFALFVAMLFTRNTRMIGVYRTVYYLPSIIGGSVAVSVLWRTIFGSQGLVTQFLLNRGIIDREISWIKHPDTAMATLVILAIWQFGSPMLVFLAGLKDIPRSLYEAAEVDGANPVSKFFRITLPMISPIIFFNLVMQLISGFLSFTQAYVITQGGPNDKTLLYVLYMYNKSFQYNDMGFGSAMAWFLLVIMGIVTIFMFRSSSYWVFYESESN